MKRLFCCVGDGFVIDAIVEIWRIELQPTKSSAGGKGDLVQLRNGGSSAGEKGKLDRAHLMHNR